NMRDTCVIFGRNSVLLSHNRTGNKRHEKLYTDHRPPGMMDHNEPKRDLLLFGDSSLRVVNLLGERLAHYRPRALTFEDNAPFDWPIAMCSNFRFVITHGRAHGKFVMYRFDFRSGFEC